MQFQFLCESSVQDYVAAGTDNDFPAMHRCRKPSCNIQCSPKKHGFYWRFYIDPTGVYRIAIRRYYCPYCGTTFSFLPSFCFSFFQYCSTVISDIVVARFFHERSYASTLETIEESYPDLGISLSHVKLYAKRFLLNLSTIELVLRDEDSIRLLLTKEGPDNNSAKRILGAVLTESDNLQNLAKIFLDKCQRSFLSLKSHSIAA